MIGVLWPLWKGVEPESRREHVTRPSQIAAPPLLASISLNLLARTPASMPPVVERAAKRQQSSIGCQLTTEAAAPNHVVLETAVIVFPADIEHNCQVIVVGVAPPCKPSADEKKQRASIVSQLAVDFNAFKQSLGR